MGTRTFTFAELRVKAEQMILFSRFGASFHPLALSHELDALVHLRNEDDFRFLLNFDDLLSTILGEEDAWAHVRDCKQEEGQRTSVGIHVLDRTRVRFIIRIVIDVVVG